MARSITPSRDSSEEMKTSITLQSRGCGTNRSTPSFKQENPLQGKKSCEFKKDINWPFVNCVKSNIFSSFSCTCGALQIKSFSNFITNKMVLFMQMYYTVDTVAGQIRAYLHAVTSFS